MTRFTQILNHLNALIVYLRVVFKISLVVSVVYTSPSYYNNSNNNSTIPTPTSSSSSSCHSTTDCNTVVGTSSIIMDSELPIDMNHTTTKSVIKPILAATATTTAAAATVQPQQVHWTTTSPPTTTTVTTTTTQPPPPPPPSSSASSSSSLHENVKKNDKSVMIDNDDNTNKNYYIHTTAGCVVRRPNHTYKCQWQNYRGYIIAGSKAIVFQGSFFLFDKTFVLSWDNIRQVVLIDPTTNTNDTNTHVQNYGIEIIMSDETVHSFTMNQQQQQPNQTSTTKVWLSLLSLHNDALLGRQQYIQTTTTTSQSSKSCTTKDNGTPTRNYKRRNSDPASSSSSSIISEEGDDDDNYNHKTSSTVPIIRIITSTSEELPVDTIMVYAGTPLRLQPIHCTYNESSSSSSPSIVTTNGRLYIGNHAIVFTGKKQNTNYYFTTTWDHSIIIVPWMSIQRIQQQHQGPPTQDATSIGSDPGCIGVRLVSKGDTIVDGTTDHHSHDTTLANGTGITFDFCNIETPDQVWASLVAIQNEKLLSLSVASLTSPDHEPNHKIQQGSRTTVASQHTDSSAHRRKSHRRTNSDPMMASVQLNFDSYQVEGTNSGVEVHVGSTSHNNTKTNSAAIDEIEKPVIAPKEISLTEVWLSIKNRTTTSTMTPNNMYSNVVIDNEVIKNCTLDRFYDIFINDNAPNSLERFLTERGDFDVRTTNWDTESASNDDAAAAAVDHTGDVSTSSSSQPKQYKRVIRYMHPVNVPLAPPQAGARKEQTVTRYGDVGICIVTQTFVDDVPMTDCFYVADRMLIEPSAKDEGITIRMEFGITFVKSTMFKGIISKKTTAEFIILFKALAQYISDALMEMNNHVSIIYDAVAEQNTHTNGDEFMSQVPAVDKVADTGTVVVANKSKSFVSVERILLFVIVIIQLWTILELKGLKHAMVSLERHQQYHNTNKVGLDDNGDDASTLFSTKEI